MDVATRASVPGRFGLRPMTPRDPSERERAASPLELFFDLVFVVAVSFSSGQLYQAEEAGGLAIGVVRYLMVFFAIWWAWMNFTWFATGFDNDDWLYRLTTLLQMGGALVLAAGVKAAMVDADFTVVTIGYVVMRIAMVGQWLRASVGAPDLRRSTLTYAVGIAIVQVLWVARLALPAQGGWEGFLVLVLAELAVPVIAESRGRLPVHQGHIAERYGCFTLIVLGESVLASTNAIVDALEKAESIGPLLEIAACGLVLAGGMWWVYFAREHAEHFGETRRSFVVGYGHYVIFAAAGAFSAGIEVLVGAAGHAEGGAESRGSLDPAIALTTLTVPVALYLLATWWFTLRGSLPRWASTVLVVAAVVCAASALVPWGLVLAAASMVVAVVAVEIGSD